jgi:hypothetical protein
MRPNYKEEKQRLVNHKDTRLPRAVMDIRNIKQICFPAYQYKGLKNNIYYCQNSWKTNSTVILAAAKD